MGFILGALGGLVSGGALTIFTIAFFVWYIYAIFFSGT